MNCRIVLLEKVLSDLQLWCLPLNLVEEVLSWDVSLPSLMSMRILTWERMRCGCLSFPCLTKKMRCGRLSYFLRWVLHVIFDVFAPADFFIVNTDLIRLVLVVIQILWRRWLKLRRWWWFNWWKMGLHVSNGNSITGRTIFRLDGLIAIPYCIVWSRTVLMGRRVVVYFMC